MPSTRVLLVGLSTRALAESAVAAGFEVASVDAFADLDHPGCPALSLERDFGVPYAPEALVRSAATVRATAVSYVASLENHPGAVAELARGRALWGNGPAALAGVRDPAALARALRDASLPALALRATAPPPGSTARRQRWLLKPRASGGGHGIRPWRPGIAVRRSHVLQRRVDGTPVSLAFVADGAGALPFALSLQLAGEPALGASPFQYCGNIVARVGTPNAPWRSLLDRLAQTARALAKRFQLVGVNAVDAIVARDGTPYVTELNPRPSGSMELAERAFGFSVFGAHAAGCRGALPAFDLAAALGGAPAVGKAIVFARHDVIVGDTRAWLDDPNVRDVPAPGTPIRAGQPICTVFAAASTSAACRAALVRRARRTYVELERGRRRSA